MTDDEGSLSPPTPPMQMPVLLVRRRFAMSRTIRLIPRVQLHIIEVHSAPVASPPPYTPQPLTPSTAPTLPFADFAHMLLTDASYDTADQLTPVTNEEDEYPDEPPGLISDSEDEDYDETSLEWSV